MIREQNGHRTVLKDSSDLVDAVILLFSWSSPQHFHQETHQLLFVFSAGGSHSAETLKTWGGGSFAVLLNATAYVGTVLRFRIQTRVMHKSWKLVMLNQSCCSDYACYSVCLIAETKSHTLASLTSTQSISSWMNCPFLFDKGVWTEGRRRGEEGCPDEWG